jgi:hypothetical protein
LARFLLRGLDCGAFDDSDVEFDRTTLMDTVSARSERSEPQGTNTDTDNTVSAWTELSQPHGANTDNTVSAWTELSEPHGANTDTNTATEHSEPSVSANSESELSSALRSELSATTLEWPPTLGHLRSAD